MTITRTAGPAARTAAAFAAVLLAAPVMTACSATMVDDSTPERRSAVLYTPDEPLNDTQLRIAADLLGRRAERSGLHHVTAEVVGSAVRVSAGGDVTQELSALGGRGALSFRPVVAVGAPGASVVGTVPDALRQQFSALDCTAAAARPARPEPVGEMVACGREPAAAGGGTSAFVLGAAAVDGAQIAKAVAFDSPLSDGWEVKLTFTASGGKAFADLTTAVAAGTEPANQVAVVLDGTVISHPRVASAITSGATQITGGFDRAGATALAAQLSTTRLPTTMRASKV
ncbi:SecDF P1 head subdomain-containing protein [Kitasatospora sp. KL5]|uniref:SecDF P1 head subdomain-containing protein n=1 Tax=Kitasatospora sp. KL5 TaxID=3425125 RepID=UPI003D6E0126